MNLSHESRFASVGNADFAFFQWDGSISSLILFPSWHMSSLLLKHHVALDHTSSGTVSSDHFQSSSSSGFTLSRWELPWLITIVAGSVIFLTWNSLQEKSHDRLRMQRAASNIEVYALTQQNERQRRDIRNHHQVLDAPKAQIVPLTRRRVDGSVNSRRITRQDSLKQEAVTPEPARKIETDTKTHGHEGSLEEKTDDNEDRNGIQERNTIPQNCTSCSKAATENNDTKDKTPLASIEDAGNGPSAPKGTLVKLHIGHQERESVSQDQPSPTIVPSSPDLSEDNKAGWIEEPAVDDRSEVGEQTDPGGEQPYLSPSAKDSGVTAGNSEINNQEDGDEESEAMTGNSMTHYQKDGDKDSEATAGKPETHPQEDGDEESEAMAGDSMTYYQEDGDEESEAMAGNSKTNHQGNGDEDSGAMDGKSDIHAQEDGNEEQHTTSGNGKASGSSFRKLKDIFKPHLWRGWKGKWGRRDKGG